MPEHFRPFLCRGVSPEVVCRGRLGPLPDLVGAETLFDSGGTWRVDAGRSAGGIRLVLRTGPHPGRPYQLLDLNRQLDRAEATIDPGLLVDEPEPFVLREPLHQLWISFLLFRGHGLLVHGCGLQLGERVLLFAGESGAGKSTLARLLAASAVGRVLSDDRLVVRPAAGGHRVYGTPWHGESRFAAPGDGRLAGVYFLHHAERSEAVRLAPARAAGRLAEVCFLAGWPRDGLQHVLDQCAAIALAVPCFDLGFRPDPSVLAALGLSA